MEVLRYATDVPGQALGHKLGQMKIDELRARAMGELGNAFSLPDFHDAILSPGAVPLDLLERHIDQWVASRLREVD